MSAVIAFAGTRRLASGALSDVAITLKQALDAGEAAPVLIFDTVTSRPVEVDLRGTTDEVLARIAGGHYSTRDFAAVTLSLWGNFSINS